MSKDESKVPYGDYCYSSKVPEDFKCNCEYDCVCKVDLVKKQCPYFVYLDNGLTKCILLNITSEDDESFEKQIKVCSFNELE